MRFCQHKPEHPNLKKAFRGGGGIEVPGSSHCTFHPIPVEISEAFLMLQHCKAEL